MWGVVKKAINSDLNVPLNHLLWINDLATYGKEGYVAKNNSMIEELLKTGLLEQHGAALEEFVKLFPERAKSLFTHKDFFKTISSRSEIMKKLLKEQTFINEMFKKKENLEVVLIEPSNAMFLSNQFDLLKRIFDDTRITNFILTTDKVLLNLLFYSRREYPINKNSIDILLKSETMKNAIWNKKITINNNNYNKYTKGNFLILDINNSELNLVDINGTVYKRLVGYTEKYKFLAQNPYIVGSIKYTHNSYLNGSLNIYKLD